MLGHGQNEGEKKPTEVGLNLNQFEDVIRF
jgi:hypothetical protein